MDPAPKDRPYVTVSYAQSLDGRIATVNGESRWISGPETLELAQELRRDNQAVAVGIGTALRDDPLLTCRLPGARAPVRALFDSRLRLPLDGRLAATAREAPVLVFHCAGDAEADARRSALARAGIETVHIPRREDGLLDPRAALEELARRGVRRLLVEGGARLITAFLGGRLVDRLVLVSAPIFIGRGLDAVGELGTARLSQALHFRTIAHEFRGKDSVWTLEA